MSDERPLITGTRHDLPFSQLAPRQFEQLCLHLLAEEYHEVRRTGGVGDEGVDLEAEDEHGRLTLVQCKRYQETTRFGKAEAEKEIAPVLARPAPPSSYLLIITQDVKPKAWTAIKEAAKKGGFGCHFWDVTELGRRLRLSDAVEQFFQLPSFGVRRWNLPRRNDFFEGREVLLAEIAKRLKDRQSAALTQAITGLGGIGKTQTAIQYCYRHADNYGDLFWCNAETVDSLTANYASFARRLDLVGEAVTPADAATAFLNWLADRPSPWLAVLDNADQPEKLTELAPSGPKGHVLVTSRRQRLDFLGAQSLEVEVLEEDAAVALLLGQRGGDEKAALDVAEELGFLPLALEQARAFLEADPLLDLSKYLLILQEQRLEALLEPIAGGYEKTIAKTLEPNLRKIAEISPAAAEVLEALAFLAPDAIPVEMITDALEHFGPAAKQLAEEFPQPNARRQKILQPLLRFSLLKTQIENDGGPGLLSIHRLVQEVLKARISHDRKERVWLAALRAIDAITPRGLGENKASWPAWRRVSLHIRHHGKAFQTSTTEPNALWLRASRFALSSGAFQEKRDFNTMSFELCRRVLGDEHADTLTSMANLAATLWHQGEYLEARALQEQVLELSRRVLGEQHPHTLASMANLAATLKNQGEYLEARALKEQVLEIRRRVLGEQHPDTLTSMNNLATTLHDLGELKEARDIKRRVLSTRRELLGERHPDTLAALANLIATLSALDENDEVDALASELAELAGEVALPHDHGARRWLRQLGFEDTESSR